jgi:isopentenyldiphosphate isomerase
VTPERCFPIDPYTRGMAGKLPAEDSKRRAVTEQFDVLDGTGRRTGEVIGRDEAHAHGVWHGSFHCLMIYPREGRPAALFQLRSATKQIAAGLFDVTVGGHYVSGEDARVAGPREIAEEIGLAVPFAALVPVGRRIFVHNFTPGVRELEFQDVFLLPLSSRPGRLRLQASEVAAVLELDVQEGIDLFSGGAASGTLIDADGSERPVQIHPGDFVPCIDNYYLKLLVLARRYQNGERTALAI